MSTSLLRLAAGAALTLLVAANAQAQTTTTQSGTGQGGTTQGGTAQGTTTQGTTAQQPAAAAGDPVVAIVNGKTLRRSDVIASAQSLPPQYKSQIDAYFPALTDRLIDITLMVDEGRKEKLQDDPEVKALVAQYEDQAIREVLLRRALKDKLTDAALKQKYDEMTKAMKPQDEIRASHILVPTEAEAKAIITQLQGGGDFAKIAKEKSKDPGASNGGDLGYFGEGDMVPEFWAAASKLQKGEYSKTPVKSQFGWHVILVTDKRTKPIPPFDQMKDQLRDQVTQEILTAYLGDLHKGAKIQKFGPDGKPLPDQPAAQ
jgi:peptidyl-prolyl cis-trans isomerase C